MQFKERYDVLVEGAVVLELVSEVEDDIRREGQEFLSQQIEVVEDGEVFGDVTELAQGVEDIGFGLAVVGLQLGRSEERRVGKECRL